MEWSRIDRSAVLLTVLVTMLIVVAGCIEPVPTDPEPFCGDGVVDSGEQCDYGSANTNNPCTPGYGESCSYCTTSCTLETVQGGSCGDGVCQSAEICAADCGSNAPHSSFLAEYYSGMNFDMLFDTRYEDVIHHDWDVGAPLSGMGVDNFSVRWTGRFDFEADDYVFTASVDDGIRVYVDGDLVLESWQNQPDTTYTATVPMSAGEHTVVVEYYESHSTASVQVSWVPAGQVTTPDPDPTPGVYGARPVARSKTPSSSDTFVSTSGSGSTCSQSSPCSLSTGLSRGGHVWMLDGVYRPSSTIRLDGTTIESLYPNDKAIIDFGRINQNRLWLDDENVIRNVIVQNSGHVGVYVSGSYNLIEGVTSRNNRLSGFHVVPPGYTKDWSRTQLMNPPGGNYNTFRDSIGAYNNDDCFGTGATTCDDSDADGIGISAGIGNVIEHFSAYYNSDDGIDIWRSYKTTIRNTVAFRNAYDDAAGFEAGLRRGNGNGYKLGNGAAPSPNGHVIENSWSYENALREFTDNGGCGATLINLVCFETQEYCTVENGGFKWWGCEEPDLQITAPNEPDPAAYCGDGVVGSSEQCDEGSANTDTACTPGYGRSCSYCTTNCQLRTVQGGSCGDGICQNGESCDADCGTQTVPSGSFLGEYYTGQFDTFVTSRNDATIDFDWGQGAPMNTMDVDYFSVRWTGMFDFEADDYTFIASVDDGIRIYVDGELVLESWQNQPDTTYTETVPMSAGEHLVMVEYYESHSTASVSVFWAPADEVNTGPSPSEPSFDGTYGARPVARSKTPSSSDTFVSTSGSGSTCSQSSPCSLNTGLSRTGYVWLGSGTYYPSSRMYIGSDRIIESIDPNNKAIIDFQDASAGLALQGNDNVLRNIVVRRSSNSGVFVTGNNNLIEGVTSEHNYYSGFQVYRSWGMDVDDTSQASFNTFRDCIANYNNDNCEGTGATTCSDSDADGIGFSAGVGNVIDHCEAFYNSDDGYDFWKSYRSTITNSIAGRNGYDDAEGFEAGLRRGNGNGFKMGGGGVDGNGGDTNNEHVVIGNWAYENAAYPYVRNSGTGQTFDDNVCGTDQHSCTWSW